MTNPVLTYLAIGVTEPARVNQLLEEGITHVLFSFSEIAGNPRKMDMAAKFDNILIDSGAFSHGNSESAQKEALRRRNLTSVDEHFSSYRDFLDLMPHAYPALFKKVRGYFNFDSMDDPGAKLPEDGVRRSMLEPEVKISTTQEAQQLMEDRGLHPIPVYHFGEDETVLADYVKRYDYVGLGGLAVGQTTTEGLKKWWDAIAVKYPNQKFHLLGTSQFRAFTDHQPYSIDTTSWITDRFGNLITLDTNGFPEIGGLKLKKKDRQHFFNTKELRANNIRALKYLGKMEWLSVAKKQAQEGEQAAMAGVLQ